MKCEICPLGGSGRPACALKVRHLGAKRPNLTLSVRAVASQSPPADRFHTSRAYFQNWPHIRSLHHNRPYRATYEELEGLAKVKGSPGNYNPRRCNYSRTKTGTAPHSTAPLPTRYSTISTRPGRGKIRPSRWIWSNNACVTSPHIA